MGYSAPLTLRSSVGRLRRLLGTLLLLRRLGAAAGLAAAGAAALAAASAPAAAPAATA
ncbi:hypothetical protein F8568_045700, partial [Actinomadura sp. LD22]|nr:hypothetical protein [Actinomadura physcomitrii]